MSVVVGTSFGGAAISAGACALAASTAGAFSWNRLGKRKERIPDAVLRRPREGLSPP